MHTAPSNIPKIEPGDNIRARTLNHVAEIIKNSSNNQQGPGIHGYSSQSGTSISLQRDLTKAPIWAMITGARRKYAPGKYPSLEDPECPPVAGQFDYCFPPYNPVGCANYFYAHSWTELIEDYDISRHGSEIFPVIEDKNLPEYTFPPNNVNGALETYKRSCRNIAKEYAPSYGLFGHIHENPLYEANNQVLPIGYVTLIYYGKGSYMVTTAKDVSAGYFFEPYGYKTGGIVYNSKDRGKNEYFYCPDQTNRDQRYADYVTWKFAPPAKIIKEINQIY